jgi:hypothetical protein
MSNKPDLFMVFDVESIGLHGEGFAVGCVVVNLDGATLEQAMFACDPYHAKGSTEARKWVRENIPALTKSHEHPQGIRDAFFGVWLRWKERAAILVTDCGWPVEASFLSACIADHPDSREWNGPYPLHDLASVMLAHGVNPLETRERTLDEIPVHNPLADARQSARLLVEALRKSV